MQRILRAVYRGGVLKPLERLDLEEGEEVLVRIEESIVSIARRYREKHGAALTTQDIEKYLAERR